MDNHIKNAELYLAARLAEGDRRPDLHKNISSVYQAYLKIIRERPQDYAAEVGDMFAVPRAEQLDRSENFRSLYERLKHGERVKAYGERKRAVEGSTGYGDLYANMEEARRKTEELLPVEDRRRDLLQEFMAALVSWRVAIPKNKAGSRNSVLAAWEKLKELDPDLSWERLRSWPPYRNCLYHNDEQLSLLERWFGEARK
ncbi:MAG: hypothetical protein KA369_17615 [Spirochaetes bacterium]|nr:hypothetical protein [Spirochaetota bacterium]